MQTIEEIEEFHKENEAKYLGKSTNKGIVERVEYLTFTGSYQGNYHNRPQAGKRGLIVGIIGTNAYPVGELKFD